MARTSAFLALLPLLIHGDGCHNASYYSGVNNVTILVGSIMRTFQLYTPYEGTDFAPYITGPPSSERPLVLNWHGCSAHLPILDYTEEISRVVDTAKDYGWYAITPVGTPTIGGNYG
jgi:hypothetical protein